MSCGEIVMNASLVRKASSALLGFRRLDYPDVDPPEWQKLLAVRLKNNEVTMREVPLDYYLKTAICPEL